MDWILYWLDLNLQRDGAKIKKLYKARDRLLNLFPIDRVDLFWLIEFIITMLFG